MALTRRSDISVTITFWFLFLLLAIIPCFSAGGLDMKYMDPAVPGVYDSDYRGPQTHTYVPPPNKAHPQLHVVVLPRMFGGLKPGNARAHHHVKEAHG